MSRLIACCRALTGGLILLCCLGSAWNASAQVTLSVPSGINGAVDTALPIDVSISDIPVNGLATFKVTLDYEAALLELDENSLSVAGTLSEGWSVTANVMDDGRVTVGGFALGENYISSAGTLFTLTASLETGGSTSLVFDSLETEVEDPDGMLVQTVLIDGGVTAFRTANNAPILTAELESQSIQVGTTLSFSYEATDADGDVLRYDLINPPLGASLDPGSGALTFEPPGTGTFQFRVLVSDGSDVVTSQVAVITVQSGNSPPVFLNQLPEQVLILTGESVTFTYLADDPDGNVLTYGLVNPPAGAEIDPGTGFFSFTPIGEGAFEIIVSVTDGQELVTSSRSTITVRTVNASPKFITVLMDLVMQPGDTLTFTYQAEDVDEDPLSYRLLEFIDGAQMDSVSGVFTFVPSEAGQYQVTAEVTDGIARDTSRTAVITVNTPPVFTEALEDQEITSAMIPFNFSYGVIDAEGDALLFSIQDPPAGASIDSTGMLTYDPPSIVVGAYQITVSVTDGIDTTQTTASLTVVSGIHAQDEPGDLQRTLYPPYPNPVRTAATIRFSLSEPGRVRLAVYDVLGRQVDVILEEFRSAGTYSERFDIIDLPSGTYLYRLTSDEGHLTRSMLIIR